MWYKSDNSIHNHRYLDRYYTYNDNIHSQNTPMMQCSAKLLWVQCSTLMIVYYMRDYVPGNNIWLTKIISLLTLLVCIKKNLKVHVIFSPEVTCQLAVAKIYSIIIIIHTTENIATIRISKCTNRLRTLKLFHCTAIAWVNCASECHDVFTCFFCWTIIPDHIISSH